MSEPQLWRKRPIEIEAMQWIRHEIAELGLLEWMRSHGCKVNISRLMPFEMDNEVQWHMTMHSHGEVVVARPGDYICRDVAGQFYPCKPDVFERTHERVTARFVGTHELAVSHEVE